MAEIVNDAVELVAVDELTCHPANPRQGDLGALAQSLAAHGFYGTVVAQKGTGIVLAGNHRLMAARQAGMAKIPVAWVEVTDEQGVRILLADNRASDLATNDNAALVDLLEELGASEQGLAGALFDEDDLDRLLRDLEQPLVFGDDQPPPEPPENPITKPGDLWLLGEHRLLCGDARKAEDYARLLTEVSVDLLLTDPPYGLAIGQKNESLNSVGLNPAGDRAGGRRTDRLRGDDGIEAVRPLWEVAFPAMRAVLAPGTPYYVFGPPGGDVGLLLLLLLLLSEADLRARHTLCWAKQRATFSLGRLDYDYAHEIIAYGWVKGAAHPWYASEPQQSVLFFDRPAASPLHPTMKPFDLLGRLISNSTQRGGLVLDPFGGSGSTLIAAEALGRRSALIEIEPSYCDVIVTRYEEATGGNAQRAG